MVKACLVGIICSATVSIVARHCLATMLTVQRHSRTDCMQGCQFKQQSGLWLSMPRTIVVSTFKLMNTNHTAQLLLCPSLVLSLILTSNKKISRGSRDDEAIKSMVTRNDDEAIKSTDTRMHYM